MRTQRLVQIVLVAWNGREDTLTALQQVVPQAERLAGEQAVVTLVDNGSSDGTVAAVRARFPHVQILEFRENRGFTGGVAAALSVSDAELIVLLNNDAVPEPDWLAALVDAIRLAPPDVVGVAGKIIDMTGERVDFTDGIMTFDGHAFQRNFRRKLSEVEEPRDGTELLFPCGGNAVFRREAFAELGGFDDDYFAYLEDVDFGWRAWLSGWRITYSAEAVVRHKSSSTSDRLGSFERGVLFERNALQTVIKNFEDDLFSDGMSPVLLTLLHRLHRYVLDRNGETSSLSAPLLGERSQGGSSRPSIRERIARRLLRGSDVVVISDPLTRMQFRATEWLFRNSDGLIAKRRLVQRMRRRPDAEIFEKFPLHYVPTYPGDEALMASALFEMLKAPVHSRTRALSEIMSL